MKRILWSMLLVIGLLLPTEGGAADNQVTAPTSLFFELFGNGGVYSLNLDYRFAPAASARIGFTSWTVNDFWGEEDSLRAVPILLNYLVGQGHHWLELGGGVLLGKKTEKSDLGQWRRSYTFTTLTGTCGYRYQRPHGGFFFKAGFTPFYSFAGEEKSYPDPGFFPWLGVSFGGSL